MLQVRNISTSEVMDVCNVKQNGNEFIGRYIFGTRFFNKYGHIFELDREEDGHSILTLREGWEVCGKSRKPRTSTKQGEPVAAEPTPAPFLPDGTTLDEYAACYSTWRDSVAARGDEDIYLIKTARGNYLTFSRDAEKLVEALGASASGEHGVKYAYVSADEFGECIEALMNVDLTFNIVEMGGEPSQTQAVEPAKAVEPEPEPAPAPQAAPAQPQQPQLETGGVTDALALAFMPVFGKVAESIKAQILGEVDAQMQQLKSAVRNQATRLEIVSPQGTHKVEGVFCDRFQQLLSVVQSGKPVYMYGPAGCGKSYTAKQVATALGLPYYETSQAMFAHDLKGYGDAGGNYVETPLYKAVKEGGLFFLDEVDASRPEALVVLNNLIANRRFDFPVVGNVEAHPNFRVMAAGNTRMTGASVQYTARQAQDASFKNRFFFSLFSYDERIERSLCGDDDIIIEFAHDLRNAARETGIEQLVSYRQITDLADLAGVVNDDVYVLRGSVIQEKEADEIRMLYDALEHKNNRWAKAMKALIDVVENEKVW